MEICAHEGRSGMTSMVLKALVYSLPMVGAQYVAAERLDVKNDKPVSKLEKAWNSEAGSVQFWICPWFFLQFNFLGNIH